MTTEAVPQAVAAVPLTERYSTADLRAFSAKESARFLKGTIADPRRELTLAWELLYRLEPELYERLVVAEPLHPGILEWLPLHVPRIIEVGAGTGRLTLELVVRCDQLTAVEPAAPLRERLRRKLASAANVQIISGFFDALPFPDHSAELVIACSALTPKDSHGGDRGLARPDVALQQTSHGIRLFHVGRDLFQHSLLRGRGVKRQDLLDRGPHPIVEAKGDSGLGFLLAPLVGQIMTQWLVENTVADVDLTPFSLARFAETEAVSAEETAEAAKS